MIIAHGQVLSLDQHVAEVTRQIRLLEVSFVVWTGREHHHPRLVGLPWRQLSERVLGIAEKSRQPVNMIVPERLGQDARGDQTVRQRITRASGNLRAVRHDPPASVRRTRKIGGVKMQKRVVWHAYTMQWPQKIRLRKHQRR